MLEGFKVITNEMNFGSWIETETGLSKEKALAHDWKMIHEECLSQLMRVWKDLRATKPRIVKLARAEKLKFQFTPEREEFIEGDDLAL